MYASTFPKLGSLLLLLMIDMLPLCPTILMSLLLNRSGCVFERNAEVMPKSMVIHELALLDVYYDVSVENIVSR